LTDLYFIYIVLGGVHSVMVLYNTFLFEFVNFN